MKDVLCTRRGTSGAILIVAFWIVFSLAGLVLVFARAMRVELAISANALSSVEAEAIARGAEAYAMALVADQADTVLTLPETWFESIRVGGGAAWFLRPNYGDNEFTSFGLVDESSKLNLGSATTSALEKLPGWTSEIAAAVADWRDEDSDPKDGGVEDSYYLSLPQPYRAKNAALESVEELLLVKGITRDLLYGSIPGARWSQSASTGIAGNMGGAGLVTDRALAQGTFDLVTVWSSEPAADSAGQSKVNVNETEGDRVRSLLREVLGEARGEQVAIRARPMPPFRDVFDFASRTQLTSEELEKVYDRLGTGTRPTGARKGLINVNNAPREVLTCLPGLSSGDVDSLISKRRSLGESTTPAWIADALENKGVGLGDLITTKSYQYSTEIVAVSGDGRSFCRTRIVIDAASGSPRIVFRRDMTDMGWPLGEQLRLALRRGQLLTGLSPAGGGL